MNEYIQTSLSRQVFDINVSKVLRHMIFVFILGIGFAISIHFGVDRRHRSYGAQIPWQLQLMPILPLEALLAWHPYLMFSLINGRHSLRIISGHNIAGLDWLGRMQSIHLENIVAVKQQRNFISVDSMQCRVRVPVRYLEISNEDRSRLDNLLQYAIIHSSSDSPRN